MCVGQVAARDENLLLDDVRRFPWFGTLQDFRIRWHLAGNGLICRNSGIDHAEVHLGGLAKNIDQARRIAQARNLHQDAIEALALDQRLHGAEFVDATLDNLNRLFDRLPHARGDRCLRNGEPDQSSTGVADLEAALAAGADQTAERLRQFAQFGQRGRRIGVPGDPYFDIVGARGKPGIGDLGIAQRPADVVAHLVELVLLDRVAVDFEQKMRAALQIEAEHEMALRPHRPLLDGGFGEEIGDGAEAHHQRRQNDRQRFPPREI